MNGALGLVSTLLFAVTFSATRPATRYISLILIAVGLYFMLAYQAPLEGWIKASTHNGSLITLLLTVPLLSSILYFEPYQKHLSVMVSKFVSSPFRFYVVVSLMLTMLASLINLASFHFVHQLLRRSAEKYPARLFNSALIRGFMPNTMWSPSYIAVAFVAQSSNITWFTIAPLGITVALTGVAAMLLVGWIEYGRLAHPLPSHCPAKSPVEIGKSIKSLMKLMLQTGMLIFLIVSLEYFSGKSAMVIVPLVSIAGPLLLALGYGKTEAYMAQSRDYIANKLPLITNEIILFTAIGFFGYSLGLSEVPAYIPVLINRWGIDTPLTLMPIIVFSIGLLSVIGIHPMITIASIAASLPPGSVPLSSLQMAGAYLAGYVLYSVISPLSAVTLLLGSLSKESPLTIGLRQNGVYAVVYALLSIGIILTIFSPQ